MHCESYDMLGVDTFCENLASLLLRDTLYSLQYPTRGICNRLDCVEAAIDDELYVPLGKTGYALNRE